MRLCSLSWSACCRLSQHGWSGGSGRQPPPLVTWSVALTWLRRAKRRAQGQHPAARAAAAARAQDPVQQAVGGATRREPSRRPLPGHTHIPQRRPVWPGLHNNCPVFGICTAAPVLRSAKPLQRSLRSST